MCGATESAAVSVTANVLSKSICRFDSKNLSLDFGNVDPGSPADVTATGTIGFRCGGSARNAMFVLVDDGGLHETGPGSPRMQNTTRSAEHLPYSLALDPRNGTVPKNTNQILTVTATIRATDFQGAPPGPYADTVVISILP